MTDSQSQGDHAPQEGQKGKQQFVDEHWRTNLAELSPSDRNAVLMKVYETCANRFLSDNGRIWTTAATMIPLSLLPFVALSSIKDPTSTQIIILPFTGWLLISTWFVIAQNHRAFQQNSEQRMKEIEDIWGFKKGFEGKRVPARWDNDRIKAVRNRLERVMVIPGMVLYMRYALWGIVTVLTLLVILFWPR